jgi:nucleotide-binding universal stress UspA family protein
MKSILVPIDFSAATQHVLDVARQLGAAFGAEVHLLHVREIAPSLPASPLAYGALGMPEMVPMPISGGIGQSMPANEEEEQKLEDWKQELARAGLRVTLHKPTGDVVEEILHCATFVNADAIVMGRHGHGAMFNLLVGSVTEGVLKRSTCPVLLIPSSGKGS